MGEKSLPQTVRLCNWSYSVPYLVIQGYHCHYSFLFASGVLKKRLENTQMWIKAECRYREKKAYHFLELLSDDSVLLVTSAHVVNIWKYSVKCKFSSQKVQYLLFSLLPLQKNKQHYKAGHKRLPRLVSYNLKAFEHRQQGC